MCGGAGTIGANTHFVSDGERLAEIGVRGCVMVSPTIVFITDRLLNHRKELDVIIVVSLRFSNASSSTYLGHYKLYRVAPSCLSRCHVWDEVV